MSLPALLKSNGTRGSPKTPSYSTLKSSSRFEDNPSYDGPPLSKKWAYGKSQLGSSLDDPLDKFSGTGTVREAEVGSNVIGYFGNEQSLVNKQLKEAITDLQSVAEGMHLNHRERGAHMKEDTTAVNVQISKELDTYQQQMKWDGKEGYSVQDVCNKYQLLTPAENFKEAIHIPQMYPLVPSLNELLLAPLRPVRLEQVFEVLRDIVPPLHGHSELLDEIKQVHKLVHLDILKLVAQELAVTQPQLLMLQRELETNERERAMALQLNNIQDASDKHVKSVEILEKIIEILRARLNELMTGVGDPQGFFNTINGLRNGMMQDVAALKHEKERLKQTINEDLRRMKDGMDKSQKAEDEELLRVMDRFQASNDRITTNFMEQDAVWSQILALMDQLNHLGEEHAHLVSTHTKAVEEEAKRKQAFNEFMDVAANHLASLGDALKHTEASMAMCNAVEDYWTQATDRIRDKRIEETLHNMKVKEMQQYCEAFRKYGLVAGDLVDRKQKRLAGLKKLLRSLQFGTDMATEALDDDYSKYEQDSKEFKRRSEQLKAELAKLQWNLESATHDFRATEEQLEESGVDFKPPEIEMQEYLIEKKKNYLEKQRAVLDDDQKDIDRHTSEVRKMDNQVKDQLATTQERRENLKARKVRPGNATSPNAAAMRELSP